MSKTTKLVWIAGVGLVAAAIATELRKPAAERTWEGRISGVVPYDLRPPTVERLWQRTWSPDDERILMPHGFGVGWSVNVGRVARRLGLV
jgi:uncharacterized membrane protein